MDSLKHCKYKFNMKDMYDLMHILKENDVYKYLDIDKGNIYIYDEEPDNIYIELNDKGDYLIYNLTTGEIKNKL